MVGGRSTIVGTKVGPTLVFSFFATIAMPKIEVATCNNTKFTKACMLFQQIAAQQQTDENPIFVSSLKI